MKQKKMFVIAVIVLLCSIMFSSCKTTALTVSETKLEEIDDFGNETMEFIGFKNMNKNNLFSKNYGQALERVHLAINKQDYYMDIYSLQELSVYRSTKRYVAFVDVIKHQYSYNDHIDYNEGLALGGWIVAGFTLFTLFPVYVPMICCANKNTCMVTLNGSYVLYVYDTEKKEVALTIPMEINVQDRYEGQFLHKDTDKMAVLEHYKNQLYNLWNENFIKAYRFIENIDNK
ncbi:MAG: hypothetical protein II970_06305 [Paludibacteraceae bacterium]|nr:hypothetical protein [Paludibacteraceae bacterium]